MSTPALQLRSRVPRLAEAAVERARLTVVPRRRTRAARMPFVMLVSLVLLLGVVGLLLFNTSMQQAAFAATSLEEQATTLTAREQTLKMELDVLRDPQHVAERAQEMGMVQPCNPAFLKLDDGKVLGEPCPASAANDLRLQARPPAKPAILTPGRTVVKVPAATTAPHSTADTALTSTVRGRAEGRNDRDADNGDQR
jgi:cell division protein FtsB